MKNFKLFLEAEKIKKVNKKYEGIKTIAYEIPSAVISHGGHSYPPRQEIPSAMVSQGKHSIPPKKLGEDYGQSGPHIKELDNKANPHLGSHPSEISERLHEHYDHGGLSESQQTAISRYTSSSYNLNTTLLDAHKAREAPPPSVDQIRTAHMDSALDKHALPHPMTVYSGVKFHPNELASQTPTREIHLPAYTSTTIKPSVSEEFASTQFERNGEGAKHVIRFHLQPGQKGFYIGNHSNLGHEHEFILPRNTRIKLGEQPDTSYRDGWDKPIHIWDAHVVPHDPDDPHRRVIPDLTAEEHFDKLMKKDGSGFSDAASQYPEEVKPHHIDRALEHSSTWVREAAARHEAATPEQIHRALNDKDGMVRAGAISNPNLNHEHIERAINGDDKFIKVAALNHPNATMEQKTKGLADKNMYRDLQWNLTSDTIHHVLDHRFGNDETHEKAALNILNDGHYDVNDSHIEKGISHPNPNIRAATYKNFRYLMNASQVQRIKADTHPTVRAELRE